MKDRLQFQASYTYSHTIANGELDDSSGGTGGNAVTSLFTDLTNPRADRGNTTINRPHIFVANAIYNLPKFANSSALVKQAIGGWEISTILTASSGASLTVFDNSVSDVNVSLLPANSPQPHLSNLLGTGYATNNRPSIVSGVSCNSGVSGPQIINPAAFTLTGFTLGTLGNEPRGYCHGPRFVNGDLGIHKTFSVSERFKLQFRLDAFNAFNHANFRADGPDLNTIWTPNVACGVTVCGPGGAGLMPVNRTITATDPKTNAAGKPVQSGLSNSFGKSTLSLGPREIQYGLKLTF
jgi:hypothetical protein